MSENTIEQTNADVIEVPDYGPVTLKELPQDVQDALSELGGKTRVRVARAIRILTALTNEHNYNCSLIKRAADDNKDPKAAIEQIRVSNPNGDKDLDAVNKKIDQLHKTLEKLMEDAHKIAEKQLTASVSIDEAEARRKDTQKSSKVIRDLRKNLETIANVVDEDVEIEGGIMSLIPEADSLRGVKLSGGEAGETGAAKLRIDKIYLDGEAIETVIDGDKTKTSFSRLAAELNKRFSAHKDPANKTTAVDLSNLLYDAIGLERGTKQAEIKENEVNFVYNKSMNFVKNGEVVSVPQSMKIRVVFDYSQWLQDSMKNEPTVTEKDENGEVVSQSEEQNA